MYSLLVIVFGYKRITRRKTPYVKMQTLSLMTIQILPLFILPYFLLPYLGNNGVFDSGIGKSIADALFPLVNYGHGREYWRAFGIILAWPLFAWNVFTAQPLWWWLGISLVQTFVIIPGIVYFWGKGAYCGWICSCGAMAETLGDTHRHKMPHGAGWNRANMLGQAILAVAFLLLVLRIIGWATPGTDFGRSVNAVFNGMFQSWSVYGIQLNYKYVVDLFLAGAVGYGTYFWFSGRVWCRFACPLAALMHIYARFSRFRILANKKKCISCNVCTSVCHQGIDIMNFANKGLPMEDPECVRCSACVQSCPTGVLQFGQIDRSSGAIITIDGLDASPVLMREK
jgi:polyferredoxin